MSASFLNPHLFNSARQCRKRLWLEVHRRDLITLDTTSRWHVDGRSDLRSIAHRQISAGGANERVMAPDSDFSGAMAQTRTLLTAHPTHRPLLFDAAFEHEGVQVRVDVLMRFISADRLIAVVAGSEPIEDAYWRCAVQAWVVRGAGRRIQTLSLDIIDERYMSARDGEYLGLLTLDDCTQQVERLVPRVPALAMELKRVLSGPQPDVDTGRHCNEPHECPFLKYCHATKSASTTSYSSGVPGPTRE